MTPARWFSLGAVACIGACALGKVAAQVLFDRSMLYPHLKEI